MFKCHFCKGAFPNPSTLNIPIPSLHSSPASYPALYCYLTFYCWHRNAKWSDIKLVEGIKLKQKKKKFCKIHKLSYQPLGKPFHHDNDWIWATGCPGSPVSQSILPRALSGASLQENTPQAGNSYPLAWRCAVAKHHPHAWSFRVQPLAIKRNECQLCV